jgi:hypothetical protein
MSGAQMSLYTLFRMYNSPNRSASQVHREILLSGLVLY